MCLWWRKQWWKCRDEGSGNAANVTGTVAIDHGGTGATTRLNAVKALTNESVGTAATYFLTITDSWGKAGYTSKADAKTVLGLGAAAYMGTGTSSTTVALGNHTHGLSLAADSGTSSISLAANTKYKLTAGGSTYIFTTPSDTTYSSQAAASGGTAVSLVTTGEKYTWNNKSNLAIGTSATTAAAGNHTHSTSIATSTGTNQLTLSASTKYAVTAGGTSYIFTTPPDTRDFKLGTSRSGASNNTLYFVYTT